jgi:hydrogenase maturation protease
MRTLLIACGNPLRRDDGAGHAVAQRIERAPDLEVRSVQQLTPELAADIGRFDRVVFIDADAASTRVAIERADADAFRPPMTHATGYADVVALSRALFGFTGEALLCRVPARDFSPDAHPGDYTLPFIQQAAEELEKLL